MREENSLWEVAGGLLLPTSLILYPGRGPSISEKHAGGRVVLQSLIMCTDALPSVPASAYTYSLHSSVGKIILCGDLFVTLDKSRLFNLTIVKA